VQQRLEVKLTFLVT